MMTISKSVLKKVVEELFEEILKEPYLSRLLPSYQNLIALVNRISNLLEEEVFKAVKARDKKRLSVFCYNLGRTHLRLQIPEVLMFRYIEKFERILSENGHFLDLDRWDIAFWIETCKKCVGLAYIEGLLKDALETIEDSDPVAGQIRNLLKRLLQLAEELRKNPKKAKNGPVFNLFKEELFEGQNCYVGKLIKSVEFQVKGFSNLDLKLKFESDHKDLHRLLYVFLEYLYEEKFEGATYILRELILKGISLSSVYKELNLKWELEGQRIFFTFLADRHYSNGVLKLIVPRSESEKVRDKLNRDFENTLKRILEERLKTSLVRHLFVARFDGITFVYIDKSCSMFKELDTLVDEALKEVLVEKTVSLLEGSVPIYGVGEIDSTKFHDLSLPIVEELVELMVADLRSTVPVLEDHHFKKEFDYEFESLLSKALENLTVRESLTLALKRREITLFYQPVVELPSKKGAAIEILSRVRYKNSFFSPAVFVEFLKKKELTVDFDVAVLNTVKKHLGEIERVSKRLFVNLFPDSLASQELVELLLELLGEMERKGMHLTLELTEHTVITNRDILEKIEKGNLSIAFDDFGSGYTNFRTVGLLASQKKARYLKIDGELVASMAKDRTVLQIVKSMAAFGKNLGLELIFEHVSDEGILRLVLDLAEELGIEKLYCQGYLFSPPKPLVVV